MKFLFSLGFSSLQNADTLLRSIKEAGFDGVEPTLLPQGYPSVERGPEEADNLRRIAGEVGLSIPSMRGGPLFWSCFSSSDPLEQQTAVSLLDKAAQTLHRLGGTVLLVVPGRYTSDQRYEDVYSQAVAMARRAADIANRYGITIALENVHNRFLQSASEWSRFIDEVGRPEIRCYYDIGNTVYSGLGDPAEWIRELGRDRIRRIHVKDVSNEGDIVPLLHGRLDWPKIACSLTQIEYDDWIGAELPLPQEDPLPFLRATRKALNEIMSPSPIKQIQHISLPNELET